MNNLLEYFVNLNTIEQVRFLKGKGEKKEAFQGLKKAEKIEFLKTILRKDLSSKTIASAIKVLREMGYNDRYFYRKFLLHVDSSVSNAARKAVNDCSTGKDTEVVETIRSFQEGGREDRLRKITSFLEKEKSLKVEMLISLLKSDDLKTRDAIKEGITSEHEIDENQLIHYLKKGSAWYVRSGIVAILGKRKSSLLLDIIESLVTDQNVEVRLELIEALSKFDRDKVKPYLERLTHDPLVWVRKRAQKILSRI